MADDAKQRQPQRLNKHPEEDVGPPVVEIRNLWTRFGRTVAVDWTTTTRDRPRRFRTSRYIPTSNWPGMAVPGAVKASKLTVASATGETLTVKVSCLVPALPSATDGSDTASIGAPLRTTGPV